MLKALYLPNKSTAFRCFVCVLFMPKRKYPFALICDLGGHTENTYS